MLHIKFVVFNLMIISLFSFKAYCQNIELILAKKTGGKPTKCIYYVENTAENESFVNKAPKDIQDFIIYEFDFQFAQTLYNRFRSKQLSQVDSLLLKNIDISNQCEQVLTNTILILSGFNLNKRIIIVDNNHNQDFRDDKVFVFDKNIQIKDDGERISDD